MSSAYQPDDSPPPYALLYHRAPIKFDEYLLKNHGEDSDELKYCEALDRGVQLIRQHGKSHILPKYDALSRKRYRFFQRYDECKSRFDVARHNRTPISGGLSQPPEMISEGNFLTLLRSLGLEGENAAKDIAKLFPYQRDAYWVAYFKYLAQGGEEEIVAPEQDMISLSLRPKADTEESSVLGKMSSFNSSAGGGLTHNHGEFPDGSLKPITGPRSTLSGNASTARGILVQPHNIPDIPHVDPSERGTKPSSSFFSCFKS